jgi:hypothetical protein
VIASYNEKLLLHNGLCISPLSSAGDTQPQHGRSLKEAVALIDNERDLNSYVASHFSKVPVRSPDIIYEKHQVLGGPVHNQSSVAVPRQPTSSPNLTRPPGPPPYSHGPSQQQQATSIVQPQSQRGGTAQYLPQQSAIPSKSSGSRIESTDEESGNTSKEQPTSIGQQSRSFGQPATTMRPGTDLPSLSTPKGGLGSSGPPQLSTLPFQSLTTASVTTDFQHEPNPRQPALLDNSSRNRQSASSGGAPMLKPVFGLTLQQLFDRDNSAVPMIVYQCIQAVDLFGLEVEGIYRVSGTTSHINKMKAMFDNGVYPQVELVTSRLIRKKMRRKWTLETRKASSTMSTVLRAF